VEAGKDIDKNASIHIQPINDMHKLYYTKIIMLLKTANP